MKLKAFRTHIHSASDQGLEFDLKVTDFVMQNRPLGKCKNAG